MSMNKATMIALGVAGVFLILAGVLGASDKPKSIIRVYHLSPMSVGIRCENGADPTGTKVGEMVIISCGR